MADTAPHDLAGTRAGRDARGADQLRAHGMASHLAPREWPTDAAQPRAEALGASRTARRPGQQPQMAAGALPKEQLKTIVDRELLAAAV